jgi:hypothetical protein
MSFRVLFLLFVLAASLQAAPEIFESSSLKYLYEVSLSRKGDAVSGTFQRSEYGVDKHTYHFEGKVVPTPWGRNGTYLKITFSPKEIASKGLPYDMAPGTREIVWHIANSKSDSGKSLFIPILGKVGANPPTWKQYDLEFEPKG